MPTVGEDFRRLHELQIQLREVQEQLAKGPRQIKARRARIAEAESAQAEREKELKEARSSADKKNLDLRTKETHLGDLQAKLNQASSNREFDILRGQMDADRAAKAVLEDEILEWLERVDSRQKDIAAAKTLVQEASRDSEKFAAEFESRSVQLREEERTLQAQIKEAEKIIPGELAAHYRRLVAAQGADALASTENGVCNHCNVTLTSQNKVLLNSGKLLICHSCDCVMYPAR